MIRAKSATALCGTSRRAHQGATMSACSKSTLLSPGAVWKISTGLSAMQRAESERERRAEQSTELAKRDFERAMVSGLISLAMMRFTPRSSSRSIIGVATLPRPVQDPSNSIISARLPAQKQPNLGRRQSCPAVCPCTNSRARLPSRKPRRSPAQHQKIITKRRMGNRTGTERTV